MLSSLLACNCCFGALFNAEKNSNRAGRPRFVRNSSVRFYFGIGIGINPYEELVNPREMQLSSSLLNILHSPPVSLSSHVNFIGMPSIFIGFIPSRATFLRNNLELYFQMGTLDNGVTKDNTVIINGTTYGKLDMTIFTTRVLYELYFHLGSKKTNYSIFFGGGFGIAYQLNKLQGGETTGSGTSATVGDLKTIASNAASFAPVFAGTVGATFDMSPSIAIEAKVRYVAMMTPFGSTSGTFDIYRNGVEIFANLLIKV